MCISDWSSDVCSSDLVHLYCPVGGVFSLGFTRYKPEGDKLFDCEGIYAVTNNDGRWAIEMVSTMIHERGFEGDPHPDAETEARLARDRKSTRLIQSLMRISYAVVRLHKKKTNDKNT